MAAAGLLPGRTLPRRGRGVRAGARRDLDLRALQPGPARDPKPPAPCPAPWAKAKVKSPSRTARAPALQTSSRGLPAGS